MASATRWNRRASRLATPRRRAVVAHASSARPVVEGGEEGSHPARRSEGVSLNVVEVQDEVGERPDATEGLVGLVSSSVDLPKQIDKGFLRAHGPHRTPLGSRRFLVALVVCDLACERCFGTFALPS